MNRDEATEFFNRVALHSGISDIRMIRSVYYGIIKSISSELIRGLPIEMPEFGTFKIVMKKEHMGVDIRSGEKVVKKKSALLRFKPCHAIKMWCQGAKTDEKSGKET
jgi:nucleoid DNA-binding protein